MSHTHEFSCPVCRRIFSDCSETGVCPECGTNAGTECSTPSGHVNDFRRYSFLCSTLRMFSAEYGFAYSVHRKGSVIEIRIGTGPGSEFLSLDMEDSEISKTEKMSQIIRRIVTFSQ